MSGDVLIAAGPHGKRCQARVAAFDGALEPALRARRGPWANTEPAALSADAQIAAWLAAAVERPGGLPEGYSPLRGWLPGTSVHLALAAAALGATPGASAEGGAEFVPMLAAADPETPLEWAALDWAGRRLGAPRKGPAPPLAADERPWPATLFVVDRALATQARQSGNGGAGLRGLGDLVDLVHRAGVDQGGAAFSRSLYATTYGSVVLDRRETFDAAHATAESLLGLFEMRKHAFGLTGSLAEPVDLHDLCLVRAVWRLLAEVVGDHRFLNGALKLAEWMRSTVVPAARGETLGEAPWLGMRRVFPESEDPFFSTEVAALHLLAARSEARMAADLAGTEAPRE